MCEQYRLFEIKTIVLSLNLALERPIEKSVTYLYVHLTTSIAFCKIEHRLQAFKYFAALIIRTSCKEKNEAIKTSKKRSSQNKLRRLNV